MLFHDRITLSYVISDSCTPSWGGAVNSMHSSLNTVENFRNYLSKAFTHQGIISSLVSNFEERPQQQEMALLTLDCLNNQKHLLVEAGTGVGKSLAYLLPVVYWSLSTKKRIIISTYTVNLQQQLANKDIPMIANIFAKRLGILRYSLFKGRSHYLCLRKWNRLYDKTQSQLELVRAESDDKKIQKLARIIDTGTWDGDRETLSVHISDMLWTRLCSESNRCMSSKCPFRESCFYQKQRRHLESCHIIVVNHALFAADLKIRQETAGKVALLPGYEAIVFDEAHHLESVFRNSMTFNLGHNHLKQLSDDTLRFISRAPLSEMLDNAEKSRIKSTLSYQLKLMDAELTNLSSKQHHNRIGATNKHLTGVYNYSKIDRHRLKHFNSIDERIAKSLKDFSQLIIGWTNLDLSDEERFEASALSKRYLDMAKLLENINTLQGDSTDFVYWSQIDNQSANRQITLNGAPLEVNTYLAENLWESLPSAILTSATLTTGNSFEYISRLLGIKGEEAVIGSPFDYSEQVCLCVPQDHRGKHPNSPVFDDYVSEMVLKIVDLAQGRTFVLFTSRRSLSSVSRKIRDKIEEKGYPTLIQGESSRQKLLEEFKNSGNAVLMGLDSFWEGVDVPGDALCCVVLAKLPFPVPKGPVMQAREALWKAQGLNPFIHYSLPTTTLKLKQGFGRLIRSKTDRGAVVILDSRIITRRYGQTILESLPTARFSTDITQIAYAVPPLKNQ